MALFEMSFFSLIQLLVKMWFQIVRLIYIIFKLYTICYLLGTVNCYHLVAWTYWFCQIMIKSHELNLTANNCIWHHRPFLENYVKHQGTEICFKRKEYQKVLIDDDELFNSTPCVNIRKPIQFWRDSKMLTKDLHV